MNQTELEANTCSQLQPRENACDKDTIGGGLTSNWLRKWLRIKAKPKETQITFYQLKTTLSNLSKLMYTRPVYS